VQQQVLGLQQQQQPDASQARHRRRPDALDWENNQRRRLLHSAAAAAAAPAAEAADRSEGYAQAGSVQQRSGAPLLAELQDGLEGWEGLGPHHNARHHQQQAQQQAQELVVSRRQALMGYNRLLANLWANDSTDGIPLLAGIEYTSLLDSWHRLQCNPGCVLCVLTCGRQLACVLCCAVCKNTYGTDMHSI
jgi:hypothetical protein